MALLIQIVETRPECMISAMQPQDAANTDSPNAASKSGVLRGKAPAKLRGAAEGAEAFTKNPGDDRGKVPGCEITSR